MEAENPEPAKLQPRVSAATYIGWLGTRGGSSSLSTMKVLTSTAVSIRDTACEASIGGEVAVFFPGWIARVASATPCSVQGARVNNCDTEILAAAFPYAK